MSNMISRALLCGLGLASLTKDAIQKSVKELVDQSTISEQEGRKLVKDLHRRSLHVQRDLEARVEAAVRSAMKKLDLAESGGHRKKAKASSKAKRAKAMAKVKTPSKRAGTVPRRGRTRSAGKR